MTEDDTYKRLKGLSRQEAEEMYSHFYQLGMDSPTTITVQDVHDFVDERLKVYGWSSDMLSDEE